MIDRSNILHRLGLFHTFASIRTNSLQSCAVNIFVSIEYPDSSFQLLPATPLLVADICTLIPDKRIVHGLQSRARKQKSVALGFYNVMHTLCNELLEILQALQAISMSRLEEYSSNHLHLWPLWITFRPPHCLSLFIIHSLDLAVHAIFGVTDNPS